MSAAPAVTILPASTVETLIVAIDITKPARQSLQEVAVAIRHSKRQPLEPRVRAALELHRKSPGMSFRQAALAVGDVSLARAIRYWFTKGLSNA